MPKCDLFNGQSTVLTDCIGCASLCSHNDLFGWIQVAPSQDTTMTVGHYGGCGNACAGIRSLKCSVRGVFVGTVQLPPLGQHSNVVLFDSTGSCYWKKCGFRLVVCCEAMQTPNSCLAQKLSIRCSRNMQGCCSAL